MRIQKAEIADVLAARDERAQSQRSMLERHRQSLISFGMNIAGEIKLDEDILRAYRAGARRIETVLKKQRMHVLDKREKIAHTGCECLWAVSADAVEIKRHMRMIEEAEEIGRLFDIDVIDASGYKLQRAEPRKCLICSEEAYLCARSRRHSADELYLRAKEIIKRHFEAQFIENTARAAQRALLNEALTTPKPGLVDCENNGAHDDMDIFSFAASACALKEYFKTAVRIGIEMRSAEVDECFERLQYAGMQAEGDMEMATNGVNTHKGALFSMGILCCAAGMAGEKASVETLTKCAARIAAPAMERLKALPEAQATTGGEKQYLRYGYTGARGEATLGFPTATQIALPVLRRAVEAGKRLNDAGLEALCALMAVVYDSNILRRADMDALAAVRAAAKDALRDGARHERMREMDAAFTRAGISPGGSADLLALTYFLYDWEGKKSEE